jgi:hypothetical protein
MENLTEKEKELKKLFKELTEQANELLDFGDSKEKQEGRGILTAVNQVKKVLNID